MELSDQGVSSALASSRKLRGVGIGTTTSTCVAVAGASTPPTSDEDIVKTVNSYIYHPQIVGYRAYGWLAMT